MITRALVKAVPKADLHLHLDGSLRLGTLIELARERSVELPSYTPEGLCETVFKRQYANLGEYLRGFAYTCAVLQDDEAVERVAYELAQDNLAEGVRYLEVRLAPQLLVRRSQEMAGVLEAVSRGMYRAGHEHNGSAAVVNHDDLPFEFGIICCAMRSFNEQMGPYFQRLISVLPGSPMREMVSVASQELARMAVALRDRTGLPLVGFDLAGEEAGYPAAYHTTAFGHAHRHFMKKTVHAGEAYGPESIFQALTGCHANRIGHGTFLFSADKVADPGVGDPQAFVDSLVEYIANMRVTVEVCPTSNLQTIPEITSIEAHPVRRMIEHNLSVAICTDNRLVSHTTVTDELLAVAKALDLSDRQFKSLVVAGFKGSFFPGSYRCKRAYVRRAMTCYEARVTEIEARGGG